MTFSRLAIVSRRFWPIAGPTETALAELANAVADADVDTSIFTAQWEKNWPVEIRYRNFQVQRVPKPHKSIWGSSRYLRLLVRRISEFGPDAILTQGLGEESWTVARPFAESMPVVVRVDQSTLDRLIRRTVSRKTAGDALRLCHGIVADSASTKRKLLNYAADHFPAVAANLEERMTVVPDIRLMRPVERRTRASQMAARSSLSDAHPVLITQPVQPLVICACCLDSDEGVFDLLDAWPQVLKRYGRARLWIIGDGRLGPSLWQKINDRDLVYSVILPGFFDDLTEAIHAADLYVHPLREGGSCNNLSRAMRSGLCCITTVGDQASPAIEDQVSGITVAANRPADLARGMLAALSNQELCERLGSAAQQKLQSNGETLPAAIDCLQAAFGPSAKVQPQAIC